MKPDRNLIGKRGPLVEDAAPFVHGNDLNKYYGLLSRVVFEYTISNTFFGTC